MQPSPKLTSLVKALCAKHDVVWQNERACLHLQMDELPHDLVIENLGREQVSIGLYFDCEGHRATELEVILWTGYQAELLQGESAAGWAAIERTILYEGWQQYVELNANGEVVYCTNPTGQAQLARFAEDWCEGLLRVDWLAQGYTLTSSPPWRSFQTTCRSVTASAMVFEEDKSTEDDAQSSRMMQEVIEQLAAKHDVDIDYYLAFLWLDKPGYAKRLIIERIDEARISIAFAHADEASDRFILDPDMIFLTLPSGWLPIEIYCSQVEWTTYLASLPVSENCLADSVTADHYLAFTEYVAKRIRDEGWLSEGVPQPEPPWEVQEDGLWFGAFRPLYTLDVDSESNDIPF